jgi:hypothetical protein
MMLRSRSRVSLVHVYGTMPLLIFWIAQWFKDGVDVNKVDISEAHW